jgi:hypothetical protein
MMPGQGTIASPSTATPVTFCAHLQTLPDWEYSVLHHLDTDYDLYDLYKLLQTQPVVACSDGGATKHAGSFGWVLSMLDGTRLVQCNGAAPHSISSSFQSEGYGIISILLCFLTQLANYCHQDLASMAIIVGTDSKSLLTQIHKDSARAITHPNATLVPDWDVTKEIQHHLCHFPF